MRAERGSAEDGVRDSMCRCCRISMRRIDLHVGWPVRRADVDDVVQEAMLRAFRGFDGLRGGDVKAWLFSHRAQLPPDGPGAARATWLRALAGGGRCRRQRTPWSPRRPARVRLDAPRRGAQRRALDRRHLPPEHREVLILREIEELDYREIAAVTQVPIGTVMSRLARARAASRRAG